LWAEKLLNAVSEYEAAFFLGTFEGTPLLDVKMETNPELNPYPD
jgi:hypothetical protein